VILAESGRSVSLQVAILKVLSSYPDGCATVDMLKADLAILGASGTDWTDRMKRMLARAPGLDIFGQQLVLRDAQGWRLTDAGRAMLARIEPANAEPAPDPTEDKGEILAGAAAAPPPPRQADRAARPQRNFVIIEGGKSQASPDASADRAPRRSELQPAVVGLAPVDPDCYVRPNRG